MPATSSIAISFRHVMLTHVVLQRLTVRWSRIANVRRQWRPRSPDDCLLCSPHKSHKLADLVALIPWKVTRNPCSAKKRLNSERADIALITGFNAEVHHAAIDQVLMSIRNCMESLEEVQHG
jgi:hypothetical protein